ncbi:MAG: gluconate 2-dehydrogenase subunit 3 family protein [Bacteroidota bacterium]
MNRREAVKRVTFLLGGALTISGSGALAEVVFPVRKGNKEIKSIESQEALIAAIADTIIPDTKGVPGAKAAGLGPFIVMMLQDCYTADVQKNFAEGLMKVDEVSQRTFKKPFIALTLKEREDIFKVFKAEAKAKSGTDTSAFFTLIYELTCLGYFTSEIGATQALRYVHIPGRYDACVPLQPGQKAWAT